MRKYILVLIIFVSTLPLCAREQNYVSRLYRQISRYVVSQQKLPWVLALNNQASIAMPQQLLGIKLDFIEQRVQPAPIKQYSILFNLRVKKWQQLIAVHPVLQKFTLKVLQPKDIVTLSATQVDFLTRFLQNGIIIQTANPRYVPAKTEEFQHYLVRLTLQPGPGEKPIYLTANCYTHELFLSLRAHQPGLPLEPLPTRSFHLH